MEDCERPENNRFLPGSGAQSREQATVLRGVGVLGHPTHHLQAEGLGSRSRATVGLAELAGALGRPPLKVRLNVTFLEKKPFMK